MGLSWPLNCNSNYISLLPTHFLPSPAQPSTQTHCRARLLAVFGTHTPCWLQTTPSHVPSAENKGRMDKTNNGKKKSSFLVGWKTTGSVGARVSIKAVTGGLPYPMRPLAAVCLRLFLRLSRLSHFRQPLLKPLSMTLRLTFALSPIAKVTKPAATLIRPRAVVTISVQVTVGCWCWALVNIWHGQRRDYDIS